MPSPPFASTPSASDDAPQPETTSGASPRDRDGQKIPRVTARIVAVGSAGFLVFTTVYWAVMLALSHEWPKLDNTAYFRRYDKQFVVYEYGTALFTQNRASFDINQIEDGRNRSFTAFTNCPGVPPQQWTRIPGRFDSFSMPLFRQSFGWICGRIDGVHEYFGLLARVQIPALALCPVLAIAVGVATVPTAMSPGSVRTGVAACVGVVVALLGCGIAGALVFTAAALTHFNHGHGGGGVAASDPSPADLGWTTAPGGMFVFCVLVLGHTGASSGVCIALACCGDDSTTAAAAATKLPSSGEPDQAGLDSSVERRDDLRGSTVEV